MRARPAYDRRVAFVVRNEIAAAPEKAFDLMADARNEPAWNSQVSRSELLSGEPVGPGSRFLTVNRGRDYEATISTYERPSVLVFDVRGAAMDITATFRVSAHGPGSVVEGSFDFSPKGFMAAVFPLMKPMVRRDLERQSARFKAFCESA